MVGFKRRKIVEGWQMDVADLETDEKQVSLLKRWAASNKLWAISLAVVVLLTGYYVKFGQPGMSNAQQIASDPSPAEADYRDDSERAKYSDFARSFVDDRSHGAHVLEARFIDPGKFRVTVPGDISSDDIQYVSQMAAEKIRHEFGHRSVILLYVRSSGNKVETLTATTTWDADKHGFMVRYTDQNPVLP